MKSIHRTDTLSTKDRYQLLTTSATTNIRTINIKHTVFHTENRKKNNQNNTQRKQQINFKNNI